VDEEEPRRHGRTAGLVGLGVAGVLLLGGCSADQVGRGFLPGYTDGEVTDKTGRITSLWTGSWIAALAVGVLVWGLILWAVTVYRKRRDDDVLPVQLRYHIPLEVMYTVLPVLMIGVLYVFTARDTTVIEDTSATPDLVVEVYGKQWSWDFNYLDDDVWDSGVHVADVGAPGNLETLPTLYLPVNELVEFRLQSRDVIHSFWVPSFLQKMDLIPGRVNKFQIVPTQTGTFKGKCAELCGAYHSHMLFNVKVVSRADYEQHLSDLRAAGQTGLLNNTLSREELMSDSRAVTDSIDGGN
jgi:cytochrome c oxidase subunit 2